MRTNAPFKAGLAALSLLLGAVGCTSAYQVDGQGRYWRDPDLMAIFDPSPPLSSTAATVVRRIEYFYGPRRSRIELTLTFRFDYPAPPDVGGFSWQRIASIELSGCGGPKRVLEVANLSEIQGVWGAVDFDPAVDGLIRTCRPERAFIYVATFSNERPAGSDEPVPVLRWWKIAQDRQGVWVATKLSADRLENIPEETVPRSAALDHTRSACGGCGFAQFSVDAPSSAPPPGFAL
jgi:hypothetical protein